MSEFRLNYSELFYVSADKYIPEGGILQNKEELPNGRKVNIQKLGNSLAEAAFAYLYFNGHVELKTTVKKTLGIFNKKTCICSKKSDGNGLTSLEKSICDLSDGLDAHTILYRIIGSECTVPWAVLTSIAKESLVRKDYLIKEEIRKKILIEFVSYKFHLNPEKEIKFITEESEMINKMKEFSKLDFYNDLIKGIDSGIKAQIERPDNDSD